MTLLEHRLSHRSPESPGGSARPLRGLAAQGGSFTIPNSHVVLGTGGWGEGDVPHLPGCHSAPAKTTQGGVLTLVGESKALDGLGALGV